jgi:Tfp pilus assembly protein PilV
LPPFWNRLPLSPLWNCANSITQPLNSISLIQPRWSTWGDLCKRALRYSFSTYKCSKECNLILQRCVNMSCKLCTHGSEARSLYRSNYHINRRLLKKLIKTAFVVLNATQHAPYSSTVHAKQTRRLSQRYLHNKSVHNATNETLLNNFNAFSTVHCDIIIQQTPWNVQFPKPIFNF